MRRLMMTSKPSRRRMASIVGGLIAACMLVAGCQSQEKQACTVGRVPQEGDVAVRAPGTAVDVTDDGVYVDAPFVNVRVRR